MASSSSSRNVIIYAVDDKKPVIIDDSEFVSEPDMTSVEDNIWGEELMIPHKLGVENQPPPAVEEQPITGVQGGNEKNTTTPVNNEENSAQDVGTNRVEVDLTGNSQSQENEEIPTNNPEPEKTITAQLTESTHSSENTDVEMETDADDDIMPEATEGGSDILPVSSTSKLSADVGMSEMEFIAMKDSDPAAALKMLLSSKGEFRLARLHHAHRLVEKV
ncbi:hypothetical protein P8452_22789 [Trifolium repens]|nr:hypothetical protein P8452_22789 [Trifolium repens]